MNKVDSGALFLGLLLIGLGAIFFLHVHYAFYYWWPMLLVLLGAAKIAGRNVWSGLSLLVLGTWLQLIQLGLFDLTWGNAWPLLLIALGGMMTLRAIVETVARRGERNER